VLYPVMLELRDRPVLVVGGGPVAARKIEGLVAAGAVVTVIAPRFVDDVLESGAATIVKRPYEPADVAGQVLVFTATDDPVVNAQVSRDATAAGIFVNSADDPDNCTAVLPAVLRRGPVVVSVSTSGSSPALAGWLRDRVAAEVVDERAETVARELQAERARVQASGQSTEDINWVPKIERLWRSLSPR
jgi:siroheme synthase-like protein